VTGRKEDTFLKRLMMIEKSKERFRLFQRRQFYVAVILALLGIGAVVLTNELSRHSEIAFLVNQRGKLIAAEIALFTVITVESLGKMWLTGFRGQDALQMGIAVRATLRIIVYSIMAIAIVSILSESPALAVGVGSVTGIIVGFSAQSLLGNIIAGTLLAIVHPIKVEDEITIMGNTGRVVEIGIMFTQIDAGERLVLIPNIAMMTNAIQRKKRLETNKTGEER